MNDEVKVTGPDQSNPAVTVSVTDLEAHVAFVETAIRQAETVIPELAKTPEMQPVSRSLEWIRAVVNHMRTGAEAPRVKHDQQDISEGMKQ